MTRQAILKEALLLTPEERCTLADELWQSLDAESAELTAAQKADLQMRLEEHRAGKSNSIPYEEFRKQLLGK